MRREVHVIQGNERRLTCVKAVGESNTDHSPIMAAVGMSPADGRGSMRWCSSAQASCVMVGKQNKQNAKPGNRLLPSSVGIVTLQELVQ